MDQAQEIFKRGLVFRSLSWTSLSDDRWIKRISKIPRNLKFRAASFDWLYIAVNWVNFGTIAVEVSMHSNSEQLLLK